LAKGHFQGLRKAVGVCANFALVHHAVLVAVHKFYWVFYGYYVLVALFVYFVYHGGKSCGFAATRGSRYKHKAGGTFCELCHYSWQAKFFKAFNAHWDYAKRKAHAASLQVRVGSEPCKVGYAKRKIAFFVLLKSFALNFVHKPVRHFYGVLRGEFFLPYGLKLAV
jgi:hypothetical protein